MIPRRTMALALLTIASVAGSAPAETLAPRTPRRLPGMQTDGAVLLPTQWSLRPAGEQIVLGDFPVNLAIHPRGIWAAVLHAGFGEHEIVVVDLGAKRIVSRVSIPQTFYGLAFDPDGRRLFASGAETGVVHAYRFDAGLLSDPRELPVGGKGGCVTGGISTSRDGKTLYVACPWGDTVSILPVDAPRNARTASLPEQSYPYTTLASKDGRRLFVSLWGRRAVAVIGLARANVEAEWPTDSHPTEMALSPDGSLLYVACADSNTVTVLDTRSGAALESIGSALYPASPAGSTPNSLALSRDGKTLLVANADNNDVAVVDVSERARAHPLGFIPAGWYPTSVRFGAKDGRIYIANGKGLMPKANRHGPNPFASPPLSVREYIGGLLRGTLSVVETPSASGLAAYTRQAYATSPLRPDAGPVLRTREEGGPIPAAVGGSSPIRHCIYIIKENRTYDQILGDIAEGNGDADLCIFPEKVTPNHHALAREFVLLDNFYVESEVSADGHEWSTAAYATDFVEKSWPLNYRAETEGRIEYPSEGSFPIAIPSGGYIWDRCSQAKVSYRSYGEFIGNGKTPNDPGRARVKGLEGHFDPLYRSYDLDYPDVNRAGRFIQELRRFETEGDLPRFIVLRLPNDHTYGAREGKPTPTAYLADNDLALGLVVEAVSHSVFWKDTAIFVVEDDAQSGSDHVDAHRTVALAISPYARRRHVDSSLYSTASMLRTMELILGLAPMSQFDAAALPMDAAFSATPDFTPFEHRPAGVDLAERNSAGAWGSRASANLDFSKEDAADDLVLNEIVWRSVRGRSSPMPPPVRAAFVRPVPRRRDAGDDD